MATAAFDVPRLKTYPVIPLVQAGAMSHLKPFVASEPIQKALGFPGELAEDWQSKAIAKMGELLGKYRSLQVYMDACVHCGACSDKCHLQPDLDARGLTAKALDGVELIDYGGFVDLAVQYSTSHTWL